MAKAKAQAQVDTRGRANYQWTCGVPDCGETGNGFLDIDSAAADATTHYTDTHTHDTDPPHFSYENLNASDIPTPSTQEEIWATVPDGAPLTKEDLAPMFHVT